MSLLHWSFAEKYHWEKNKKEDLDGFYAIVIDAEDDDAFPRSTINQDTIVKGINKIVTDSTVKINDTLRQIITQANKENDAGDLDADAADYIIQIGLFDQIIFG